MGASTTSRDLLDRVVRLERGRLLAGLVSRFGPSTIELAEDAVQDALVDALESWAFKGIPKNGGAMLARMASNKLIDRLRREGRKQNYDANSDARPSYTDERVHSADITDPELLLIILCCHPHLTESERLTLTLKLAGGFTAGEVGLALLAKDAAVGQRISRGLRKLRALPDGATEAPQTVFDLRARLPNVLQTIYLLFSIGFMPRTGDRLTLNEICFEALRLVELLAKNAATRTPQSQALAALICLHCARLPSRVDKSGHLVLLKNQDRSVWDQDLIERGGSYLKAARETPSPSKFHLEAAIAAAHTAASSWRETDWCAIEILYTALEFLTRSPVVAVNACVARAMAGKPSDALKRLDLLREERRIADHYPVELARGEILAQLGRFSESKAAMEKALGNSLSLPMRAHIQARRHGYSESGLI